MTKTTSCNSSEPLEIREIEFFDDTWDSSNYLVCFNRYYIYAIRPEDLEPQWKFLQPESVSWDAVHQRVYRNFRTDPISRDKLPDNLPPPPDSIAPELLIPPSSPPEKMFLRVDYPKLDKRLLERDGAMAIYLVLQEDLYESAFGDGVFHYPEKVVFSDVEAYSLKAASDSVYAYHVRAGLVWIDRDRICCGVPGRLFDHFSDEDLLRMAETKLGQ